MNLGERIKKLRLESGLSQVDFANKIGISKQNLYKYENGIITNIPSDKIEKIAEVIGISPAAVMGWDEEQENYVKNAESARRLRDSMNEKGMRAQELANLSGVSKSSISHYINGTHAPSNISSAKIGKVLDKNPLWLMGFYAPEKTEQENYYDNPETTALAQEVFDDPELRILLDAKKDLSPDDLKMVIDMIKRFKGDEE